MTDIRPELIERVRDELAHHTIGSGYYQTSISVDEADELALVALAAVAAVALTLAVLAVICWRLP